MLIELSKGITLEKNRTSISGKKISIDPSPHPHFFLANPAVNLGTITPEKELFCQFYIHFVG
jgi:hypothetical protein